MPGDALLFQRLSVSTIGANWFHGRVRDGIGWVTVAKVTKQYGSRKFDAGARQDERLTFLIDDIWLLTSSSHQRPSYPSPT